MDYPTDILGWAWFIGFGGLGFLFVITLVVFVHELGHFLAARLFGVRVESFSIGFGRAIVGFKDRHGTHWKVGWLPLGGYVKFWGDEGVSSTPDQDKLAQATPEERAHSFHHKPLYQKAIIAIAGPIANFVLAIVILTSLFLVYGDLVVAPQIGRLLDGAPAQKAGLQVGDVVLSIDSRPVREFDDIVEIVTIAHGRTLPVRVRRGAQELAFSLVPRAIEKKDIFGNKVMDTGIGIGPVMVGEVARVLPNSPAAVAGLQERDIIVQVGSKTVESFDDIARAMRTANGGPVMLTFYRQETNQKTNASESKKHEVRLVPRPAMEGGLNADQLVAQTAGFEARVKGSPKSVISVRFGAMEALERATGRVWFFVVKTLDFIIQMLTGTGDYRQLSGPIGIASVSGQVLVFFGVVALINLAAVLSVSIGLLNLFPIPMLDGGHLLYYAIEAVRGRPLGERAQELGFQIGFVLVVSLMLFATWNDLVKFRLF